MRTRAQPRPCAPHEIYVARLVEKLINVRPFIRDDRDAKPLVFKRDRTVAFVNKLCDATAVIAIMVVSLIAHRFNSICGESPFLYTTSQPTSTNEEIKDGS